MASHPALTALHTSHDRLVRIVSPLTPEQLREPSAASEWSIAQVLSHLGSGAVIGTMNLAAQLAGEPAPQRESYQLVWDEWNAKDPEAQAADALATDAAYVEALEGVTDAQFATLRTSIGPMELDGAGMVTLRLGEHALHTWDVAVALDPAAAVDPAAVPILIDNLGWIASFTAKPFDVPERIIVATAEPERRFVLDLAERGSLTPATDADGPATVELPAEQFVRLTYGRLAPTGNPQVDRLRAVFPGF